MKKILISILCMLTFSQVHAIGHVSNAKVTSVRVDHNGRVMVIFDKQISGTPPSCVHEGYKNAFAVDTKNPGANAVLSWALTAKSTGEKVSVYGLGVCGVYGGNVVESWNYGVFL